MRLSARLVASVLIGVIALLFLDSWFSVRREIRLFDADMERDALHLGDTVATLIAQVWEQRGAEGASQLLASVNREDVHVGVRLVRLDAPRGSDDAPRVDAHNLAALRAGEPISLKRERDGAGGHRYTYVPVPLRGVTAAAVELAEPLDELVSYTHRTVAQAIVLGLLVVVVGAVAMGLLGVNLVGRPLKSLVDKTRRIGSGDFSGDVVVRGGDELGNLAVAINDMCRQLDEAGRRLRAENEAKIAALEQLRHSERLATLGRVASGVAHELGTPLNVVSGRAQLIASGDLQAGDAESNARIIERQAARMTRIIRQLLDYARRRPTKKTEESVAEIVRGIIEMLAPAAREKNVSLVLTEGTPLPAVRIDRSQIEQVLTNVLMNAIHAVSDRGSVEVDISRRDGLRLPQRPAAPARSCAAVRIRDDGAGIGPDQIGQVFEPFYTTKGAGEGTGLGLSVAKEIVEEHGGWIEVESEVGKGASFTVFLPLEAA